ncbi:Gfo/Idh/MocA family protein [Algoriphagus aquatilis]|uniref:Gfo/Idh/MocA family protein n=1 Tax=Algoriphagus aquatilis TaxID=490186 RepID=A0ABW0BRP9_9BACT|nr:Gfo/Idh/MocA family oxidoreductase [Algoriphagus sp.]
MFKIIVIGIGSIGKRHVSNLIRLGYKNLTLITSKPTLGSEYEGFFSSKSLSELMPDHDYSHAIICSPTASHVADLKACIELGVRHIYLEKPVSHTLEGIDEIHNLILKNKVRIQVGFDLHFDPGLTKAKEILESGILGKIYSANAFVGQYLPDWRPHENYKLGMSASKAKGGGVMLDLVHEFDYIRWLMGIPELIFSSYQHNDALGIETEDLADVLIRHKNGANSSIHLDYHQRKLIRFCLFTGENGTLHWDLAERNLKLISKGAHVESFDFSSFERNDRYLEIMRAFLENPLDPRLTSFEEAIVSLKMVLASKIASEKKSVIEFANI